MAKGGYRGGMPMMGGMNRLYFYSNILFVIVYGGL